MKVKICGLKNVNQVKQSIKFGANYCGFILNYPKSHRFISYKKAKVLTNIDKKKSKFVGVLVNPRDDELKKFSKLNIDYFQIYGSYNNNQILRIKKKYRKKIIFSVQVKSKKDISEYKKIERSSDIILWDSSGLEKSLSWNFSWIKSVNTRKIKMLAGKININNIEKISKITDIIDVSGALETNKVKDTIKIKNFLIKVKNINEKNRKR